eukprot:TRINITY_DN6286_c0_g1_i1.p1 TRINITY_DN6286_c0_g1~~TRINITY_DN6286_c0_g1_i1.p1  ORF type:complete len:288 (-),score=48.62 TRINITY_DN6286_c0_g1_i1:797-1660(-)
MAVTFPTLLTSPKSQSNEEHKLPKKSRSVPAGLPPKKKSLRGMAAAEIAVYPMSIFAKLYFEEPLELLHIRNILQQGLMRSPLFRSVAHVEDYKDYAFHAMEVEDIPIDYLVNAVPAVKNQHDVDKLCTKMSSTRLSLDAPLWRAYVINDMDDGRSLLLWQVEHVLGDPAALVKLFLSSLDYECASELHRKDTEKCPTSCYDCLYPMYLAACSLFAVAPSGYSSAAGGESQVDETAKLKRRVLLGSSRASALPPPAARSTRYIRQNSGFMSVSLARQWRFQVRRRQG